MTQAIDVVVQVINSYTINLQPEPPSPLRGCSTHHAATRAKQEPTITHRAMAVSAKRSINPDYDAITKNGPTNPEP